MKSDEKPIDTPSSESSTTIGQNIHNEDSEEDLYTDSSLKENDSSTSEMKDEEMDQVYQMSRRDYTDRELDEEAQLLLAIQRSMDSQGPAVQAEEDDEELQRVLEMSLMQHQNADAEESFQRALEMSLQDQTAHDYSRPMRMLQDPAYYNEPAVTLDLAQIKVLAGDETSIVVAGTALRKAITSKLNTVSFREMDVLQDMPLILKALEKKHKVKITKYESELQIQGFLHGPSLCWKEISEIVTTLQSKAQAKIDAMDLKVGADVEMNDVPDTSEEYKCVVQPFLNTLQDLKPFIDVLQVSRSNPNSFTPVILPPIFCHPYSSLSQYRTLDVADSISVWGLGQSDVHQEPLQECLGGVKCHALLPTGFPHWWQLTYMNIYNTRLIGSGVVYKQVVGGASCRPSSCQVADKSRRHIGVVYINSRPP